ncbi:MAG: imidazole glycerol phosphate synthase subunit HisH [Clostridia bacterium]
MIAIIDYEMGNIGSILKAFSFIQCDAKVVKDPDKLKKYDRIVLPGVGAFSKAMDNLRKNNMDQAVIEQINEGKSFMGICLGYQLLFQSSEEDFSQQSDNTSIEGLGILKGHVKKFKNNIGLKVPQIGWNSIECCNSLQILKEFNGRYFYFVHSYYSDCISTTEKMASEKEYYAYTEYGHKFASAFEKNNILACQFHPEKSGDDGIRLLKKWVGK